LGDLESVHVDRFVASDIREHEDLIFPESGPYGPQPIRTQAHYFPLTPQISFTPRDGGEGLAVARFGSLQASLFQQLLCFLQERIDLRRIDERDFALLDGIH
jgi:hypothetical protein